MGSNNALNNIYSSAFYTCLKDLKYIPLTFNNLSSGNTTLYTVPAGRKAICYRYFMYNSSGGTITSYPQITILGNNYQTETSTNVTTLSFTSRQYSPSIFLSGEQLTFNTSAAGLNFWSTIFEFSDSVPITRSTISNLVSGNNTIYTCPVGKMAYPFNINEFIFENSTGSWTNMAYRNGTANSITVSRYFVKSGDSPSANNLLFTQTSASGNTFGGAINNFSAGDSYVVNTNSALTPQIAWLNLVEVPI